MTASSLYTEDDHKRAYSAAEALPDYRSAFRRDYARLIHCPSFRRLNRKRQLLPNDESDFFRNRLTHSLEVAQIAKTIALKINTEEKQFADPNAIDTDLVEFAGLAHDLGHPPFGHTGEAALDRVMKKYGGFEGNAQTLRILARLEKKEDIESGGVFNVTSDSSVGLNLAYRTLASVLKYDKPILGSRPEAGAVSKGYYETEKELVASIKKHVACNPQKRFKTIECAIMDIADDIAYSTYDLEDAYKAGLLSPLALYSAIDRLNVPAREKFYGKICENVRESYPDIPDDEVRSKCLDVLRSFMLKPFGESEREAFNEAPEDEKLAHLAILSNDICTRGADRIAVTSYLVNEAVSSIVVTYDEDCPPMSVVRLGADTLIKIETLKRIAWTSLIDSRKLKMIEFREQRMIETIFQALTSHGGFELLPDDYRELYESAGADDELTRHRIVCDFVSGMTDRYAEGFYSRLHTNSDSIFLPF